MPRRRRNKPRPLITGKDYNEIIRQFGTMNFLGTTDDIFISPDHVVLAGFKNLADADKAIVRAIQNVIEHSEANTDTTGNMKAFMKVRDNKQRMMLYSIPELIDLLKKMQILGKDHDGYPDLIKIGFFNSSDECPLVVEGPNTIGFIAPRVEEVLDDYKPDELDLIEGNTDAKNDSS